ncbi:MAG TPA: redoxin domain-containing protein [Candidatus Limnocylindria bacterium]|nr:redoxin domain-containing protein [Candidatus Limnocylindria bacterium]
MHVPDCLKRIARYKNRSRNGSWLAWAVGLGLACCPLAWDSEATPAKTPSIPTNAPPTVTEVTLRSADPVQIQGAKAVVLLFVSVECPISNQYAPEFRRLARDFDARGVAFRLVYPNRDETVAAVRKHLAEFELPIAAWTDHEHRLVKASGVHVTPEAAVYVPNQGWAYHGRIDDRHVAFGKVRTEPKKQDLRDALEAILANRTPTAPTTPALGCSIPSLP